MQTADKLAYLKKKYHLTTRKISEQSGISIGTLNKIFSGETKNPSMRTLEKVAKALNVPLNYLTDVNLGEEYYIGAMVENYGFLAINPQVNALLQLYRSISTKDRKMIEALLDLFYHSNERKEAKGEVSLPCYIPTQVGQIGVIANATVLRWLQVKDNEVARNADFAVLVCGDTLEPIYPEGTVLAVKRRAVCNHEFGVFVYHGEGFVRRYYRSRKVTRIEALCCKIPNIQIKEDDILSCVGTVLGEVSVCESHQNYLAVLRKMLIIQQKTLKRKPIK